MAEGTLSATFILRDVDQNDPIPERMITLSAPTWQIKIGRGTASGDTELHPAPNNAWFDSRVMSRHHAILTANPETREFTIEDIGSMHGTYYNSRRLRSHVPEPLHFRDTLVFGADVTRGSSSFNALKVMVASYWSDEGGPPPTFVWPVLPPRNTFSADYSEDEIFDDDDLDDEGEIHSHHEQDSTTHAKQPYRSVDQWHRQEVEPEEEEDEDEDVQIIKESIRLPSVEVIIPPPHQESIADSEFPDSDSDLSDEAETDLYFDEAQQDHALSSPLATSDEDIKERAPEKSFDNTRITSQILVQAVETATVPATTSYEDKTFPSITRDNFQAQEEGQQLSYHVTQPDGHSNDDSVQIDLSKNMKLAPADVIHFEHQEIKLVPSLSLEGYRAPSPSDAAMVKPRIDPTETLPYTRYSTTGEKHESTNASGFQVVGSLPTTSSRDSAWAGHNSVLYEPVPSMGHDSGSYVWRSDWQAQPFSKDSEEYGLFSFPHDTTHQSVASCSAEVPSLQPVVPQEIVKSQINRSPSPRLKRKADEMSCSGSNLQGDLSPPSLRSHLSLADVQDKVKGDEIHTIIAPHATSTVKSASTSDEDNDVPARKKPKIDPVAAQTKSSGKRGVLKFAAATAAGIVIGSVGTILGLASLPPDYFV